ncbi:40S ribosomal protein S25 [Arthroderma uncinatum]|uniref:40S ribosomal protein S25 n=1 Tax=Arthroderma uncinatum TaxID=74035 RepID=UPI00144AF59A|nr:40S ribosomal protein S25 [Arthroderma uncinatum]KAF3481100.1 40S ribosomal protein S25 [Arthroderma uncinatum]
MPPALSNDGRYAAITTEKELRIHSLQGDGDVRPISLQDLTGPVKFLQWASLDSVKSLSLGRSDDNTNMQRVLCAGGNQIFVYDAKDESWSAKIDAGESVTFVHVNFSPSPDEVIAIPEFNTHLAIFSLLTGQQRVIKAPKFAGPATYAFRPNSGHLAVLSKGQSGDVLSIHEAETYETITAVNLTTTDVKGLKWSPDGHWIAVWDTASQGTMVVIYTADGQQFRSFEGSKIGDDNQDFGVKTVEWSPDSQVLAIGRHDGTIELITGTTFVLLAVLGDPTTEPIGRDVYVEHESSTPDITEYMLAPESPVFPYTYNSSTEDRIVSNISFNPTSGTVATIDESMPNIAWMCIKQLCWNSEIPDLLMTVSGDDTSLAVHQWLCGRSPRGAILRSLRGRSEAAWIKTDREMSGLFWVGGQRGYEMGYLVGTGQLTQMYKVASIDAPHPALIIPHLNFGKLFFGDKDDFLPVADSPRRQRSASSSKMAPSASAGGKKQKKKWSKGKVKDKANHAVILDKTTSEKLYKDVQSYRLITVATLVDRLKVNGSLARQALADLEEKGQIKKVVGHSKMNIYTRAVAAE